MKPIKIISYSEKSNDSIDLSKKMTPKDRIVLMFQLIEISHALKSQINTDFSIEGSNFINVRQKQK